MLCVSDDDDVDYRSREFEKLSNTLRKSPVLSKLIVDGTCPTEDDNDIFRDATDTIETVLSDRDTVDS